MGDDIVVRCTVPNMCHSPTLTQLPSGALWCAWYAGSYECASDTVLQWAWQDDNNVWAEALSINPFPGYAVGNPVVDCHPDVPGLTLYFSVVTGPWWTDALLVSITSADQGRTWTTPRLLSPERGLMPRTNVLHLKEGSLLLPIYREQLRVPVILRSEDQGRTWDMTGDTTVTGYAIQPAVVELPDDTVAMFTRSNQGRVFVSYSFNHGKSWTASRPTLLPNPNSSVAVTNTPSGQVLIVYNPSDHTRDTIAYSTSDDGGETWDVPHVIMQRIHGELSYPSLWRDRDGRLHVVFTENRTSIHHCVLQN
ncbi:MAG: hypothetical protein C7B46_17235 [Sulfobacillus benefaciens]|uniref:Sialidase domain-containing protein n=1 Tax=Sulfobacillus benefaciens TaxID=453960 RepID=A0A2T2X975_9FIRM|nr:MAG: hypothetical protein C7B46_17235 [Sulfobacillus benefaciens]